MTELMIQRTAQRLERDQGKTQHVLTERDLRLAPQEQRTVSSQNGYLLLLDLDDSVTVESDTGVYDCLSPGVSECQHVHAGEVVLKNYSDELQFVEISQLTFCD